ncbi:MAG: hypothetical protein EHM73_14555 [Chroococcales cyanobacterium metabat2.561]|jgi:hypothetical protein|uniref:Uncharacterized protein n=1 Tax=Microcystis aeruginosa Ma_SC_T_19800800_S464 TaxID=2486257 RepID=A0A552DXK4_MICAE|nr:MAG: hypothetical protein EHM73_14555 [Chroococcales cyanobacterium metabat2.561]TRU26894.1 MAG: hypothetical protein EWV81_08615 [Microcystis aeruginosa Ma_SC_T_19800800_S464]
MTQAILTQILNQLETLELKELQQLNQKIQQYLMDKEEADKQALFHQSLLDARLVKQIKRPSSQPITERRLIEIEGKPISETIIEERR